MGDEANTESMPGIDKKQACEGVKTLLLYHTKTSDAAGFLGEAEHVHLQICMKKVPKIENKIIKITLPNSALLPTSDVCLFVRDLNKKHKDYEPTERHFQALLDTKEVKGVTKILPMKAIKLEYKPFEAKRNLSDMFDMFLADAHIVRLLPGFLGKSFYGRKRYPVQVNLETTQLSKEFERAMHTAQCIIGGRGPSCQVTIGHSSMTEDQLTENLHKAMDTIAKAMPGGVANIRNMHIKLGASPAIPVYISLASASEVNITGMRRKRKFAPTMDDNSILPEGKIRVRQDGRIRVIHDRPRDPADAVAGKKGNKKAAKAGKSKPQIGKGSPAVAKKSNEETVQKSVQKKTAVAKTKTVSKVKTAKSAKVNKSKGSIKQPGGKKN